MELLLYNIFRWLRFPLIVGVVFIHCMGTPVDVNNIDFYHLSSMNFYDLIRIAGSNVLPRVCVPLFFFISGYLFFTKLKIWNWKIYTNKLRKRFHSIFIPYIIWITLAILYQCAVLILKGNGWQTIHTFFAEHSYWHLYWNCFELDPVKVSWTGMNVYSSTPYHYALWYLRDLMLMMLLAPGIHWLFRKCGVWALLLLLVNYVSNIGAVIPELQPTPLLFFGSGAFCKMYDIDVINRLRKVEKLAFFTTLCLFIPCVRYNSFYTYIGNLFFPFFVITGSITVFCLAARMVQSNRWPIMNQLSEVSFFVYLVHTIALTPLTLATVKHIVGEENALYMIIGYLAAPVLIICESLMICYFMKCFLPRTYRLLTGNR